MVGYFSPATESTPKMEDTNETPALNIAFQKQLARIQDALASKKSHARGPKRPSLGQQDEKNT